MNTLWTLALAATFGLSTVTPAIAVTPEPSEVQTAQAETPPARPSLNLIEVEDTTTVDPGEPVEVKPHMWQWTPPEERSEGSKISEVMAMFNRDQRGFAYTLPRFAIASEQSWPDALLAANTGHTLLLNESKDLEPSIHTLLVNAIRAHRAAGVQDPPILFILGGPNAISNEIANQIQTIGYETVRIGGQSRIETSVGSVLSRWFPTWKQLMIVRAGERDGEDPTAAFADTITALQQAPAWGIALTPTEKLHSSLSSLLTNPGQGSFLAQKDAQISLWGGPQAISEETMKTVQGLKRKTFYRSGRAWLEGPTEKYKVDRISGESRYATNIAYQKLSTAKRQAKQQAKVKALPIVVIDGAGPYSWQLGYAVQEFAKDKAIVLAHKDGFIPESESFIRAYARPSAETPVYCFAQPHICEQVDTIITERKS